MKTQIESLKRNRYYGNIVKKPAIRHDRRITSTPTQITNSKTLLAKFRPVSRERNRRKCIRPRRIKPAQAICRGLWGNVTLHPLRLRKTSLYSNVSSTAGRKNYFISKIKEGCGNNTDCLHSLLFLQSFL